MRRPISKFHLASRNEYSQEGLFTEEWTNEVVIDGSALQLVESTDKVSFFDKMLIIEGKQEADSSKMKYRFSYNLLQND